MVVVQGEPGIGKTRLAREFLGWVAAQGADVIQGRAFETGGRLPYQPLVDALRSRIELENAPEDLLSDIWLIELGRLLPELHERYPDLLAAAGTKRPRGCACSRLLPVWGRRSQADGRWSCSSMTCNGLMEGLWTPCSTLRGAGQTFARQCSCC